MADRTSTKIRRNRRENLRIENVLFPIDFSKASLDAVELALPLVKHFGADLHLVHVFEPDYPFSSMMALPIIVPELEVGRRVRRHLKEVARKYSLELRHENIQAIKGQPFVEICRLAREQEMDLIVIATRGNIGLKHLALGSTAERVVRYSPCPVLVLHQQNREQGKARNGASAAINFRKILVPIDFSDCSLKGLNYAKAIAREFGSKLLLLNSVALQYCVTNEEYARYDFAALVQESDKLARKQMLELVEETSSEGFDVMSDIELGHAGQQICAAAQNHGVDAIITSTHGTTGLKHLLLGSTAEYVVRHATCPVLVMPSHERPRLLSTSNRT